MRRFLVILLLFTGATSFGRTFYLSPTGNDSNPGTLAQPFFTLKKVWTVIMAGDTVFLYGGVYQYESTQDIKGKNGTASNNIKIWAIAGETPVITRNPSGDFKYIWTCGIWFTGDYFHWKGIEITGFTQEDPRVYTGFRISDSNNNIFELINSHHNGHGCEITGKSSNNLVLNSDFHNNQDPLTATKYENADGLEIGYIPAGLVNKVKGCRFWNNTDDGIDLWENDGAVQIDSCWSWNNGYIPGTNTPAGNGNGFKLGITTIDHGSRVLRIIKNCVAYKNRSRGFDQNNALCSMELFNNTASRNGTYGYVLNYGEIYCKVKNCISYSNAIMPAISKSSIVETNVFSDNNITTPNNLVSDADFVSLEGTLLMSARKTDGSLPDITFMHLAPGSDLIDAGADVGLPFWGMAPDIGAFETSTGEYHLNQLPVVSISSPVKGISFTSPATVTIDVEANDPDGSITKVELFNGSIKLGERTAAPYSFTLKDLPEGSYSLKVVATDNLKATSTSSLLEMDVKSSYDANREFFNLYPNPNDGRFSINFTTALEAENYLVTIVDLIGKTVYQQELSNDETIKQFDISYLKRGTYVLMISTNQILLTQKFIKG